MPPYQGLQYPLTFVENGEAWVLIGSGFEAHYDKPEGQRRPNPGGGRSVRPPTPQPQPVTSVYGLADGIVLHTTDTQRICKMVGAPVWQATCDNGICLPASRPTTQAVIDAGPAVQRDGSSAVDQRGRVYSFVGRSATLEGKLRRAGQLWHPAVDLELVSRPDRHAVARAPGQVASILEGYASRWQGCR